ncbi:voltage-dependent T-type calcium channel subunit alpha-1I isoform X5 [Gallus gallus]|uniref:voltage-dependent T-type calcium channel subunit alpha-1I isoform X5 n=2 Tax=Gallus gallus TaxID=9031 RepID=UPI000D63EE11|nr:voltage-dependent T-type calcium channel subunit alpha-1I isoform X5 [Gallus gallus]XP_040516556.1 voltage-dependent T-type calcium channel subunit alpha-1I isoform X5 [Gallus gallus]XP_040525093.1 voltage-dependent T-type calcium channel subunit alpha-1I isoform X2 [Gallus gallus]XP_040525094.1 voltage-dependent T-type calcium channel subunit alpha-1I isoform X2 [Gallus gallus]XP_040525095.1 voltage-dependent T-type calcium channel subunit alpha-1I isoform X2 [Gallus gallus]XP_046766007.1 |eukprot:XP_015144210.2 voltage-dependent T-type calcium channel subunit alpha-1I isoform X1 [Gallus gallus]
MAECTPQPPSTWPASPQPHNTSAACPLEPMNMGVSEQQMPLEQPPSSPELGEDEEVTSPPDPDVPYPDLAPVVFFCLKQTTSPRSWCIKMVCNPWFECVSMMVILLNCVTLGMYQPCEDMDCLSDRCKILQVFDDFIFIFFAMEMVLKMVALGIFGKKCYLGDTWNRLDFFIVMAGMVEYSLDLQNINLSAIRTVRVLRPLKAINRVPSMRILVNLLLDTLPMLGNVLLLCFFVFFIFGIIGVQLWAGLLRNRCFMEENFTIQGDIVLPPYYQPEEDDEMPFICSLSGDNGIMGCHEIPPLKERGHECCLDKDDYYYYNSVRQEFNVSGMCVNWNQYYNVCRTGNANPHKGAINFDNIGYAWIVIFQVITLEGWVEIMYYVMDAHSFYNFIYFILLIIVGSFFMINLCLVVIATQFSETKQREHQLMQEQRARYLSSSTVASYMEPGDCYEEIFQYVCHIMRKAKRRTLGLYNSIQSRRQGHVEPSEAKRGASRKKQRHYRICQQHNPLDCPPQGLVQPIAVTATSDLTNCPRCHRGEHDTSRRLSVLDSADSDQEDGGDSEAEGEGCRGDHSASALEKEEEEVEEGGRMKLCSDMWREVRVKLRGIVDSKYFNRGIMIAILVNTISMGIEHHEQPEELTNILEISNVVFTSMFALEMILKLAAFGLFDYLRNPYNIFDSIIVIISIWEIIGQSDGGLSVLRTFRLLRVLKLVRFMPALRRQLVVLMKTMDNVATFCMLLMLFIFIFSILGMHIFGCKFSLRTDTGDTVPDRKNFDSLLWAIVTVFQILTQEDWNVVLYNGMASTSPWASLYFVALMTFGNYVLFNLLVAILVEGFQAEGDANRSYSEEDQSSSNMEELDQFQEIQEGSDPKLCAISVTPNGHLDPSLPSSNAPVAAGGVSNSSRNSLQPDQIRVAVGSRKSSVMSLGRMTYDQRSLSSSRSSHYGAWGRSGAWGSRRSSWNSLARGHSLKHKPPSAEHESLLSGDRHRVGDREPDGAERVFHHRRTLSLDNKGSCDLLELASIPSGHRGTCRPGTTSGGSEHQDCNGRMPSIAKEIFPKMNNRKERGEDDEEIDYSLCFRIRKMMEVYKPDWCELREDWSIYLFSPQNRFRLLCQTIIAHKLFDYVVLAFIFLNCITIALERPQIEHRSTERIFLTVSNYIFTAIFVAEMTLKVVSLGLYFGDQAYLRSSWNVLDGFLVFVSLIDIVVSVASAGGAKILGVLRVLRLLRTLRPLRVISRAPGLKLVVETLISSLKPIGNIVLICCAFFIIFGILGVQLFKGKFYHCLGVDIRNITNRSDCVAANYKWVHHKYNFDNLGQALMSLFVLASKDGWVNIMYNGLDAVAVDQQPVTNNNPWMLLYFISFLLIVSFFVLNMFVGVVVENFHKCRQHQEAEEARRREEKRLRRLEKKRRSKAQPKCLVEAQRLPYYATYCPIRLLIHSVCTSHYLDIFITFIICLNVVTMSLEHYNQPVSLETALKYCNYLFTTVFVLEAVLKLVAFGLRRFFKDRWNQLDLAIVLLSVMGITLEEIEINAALPINPTIIRIMRVLRIARVLKLLKMATGMRALLDTVVQALPQVGNLGLLFMLLFFIYAALGVELFGKLVCNDENPCEGMSRHATFENFGMAFLTLFQVSTGDNWNGIMKDTLRDCSHDDRSCLSNLQFISPLYFVSFVLTAQFVLINVVVAVLMKHLDDSNKEAQEDAEMDAEIELEFAHGLCSRKSGSSKSRQGKGAGSGSGGGRTEPEGRLCTRCYSPAQENLWLDSVSLIIKDSFDGELMIIDNLSGSVFHHYSSPAMCEKCNHDKQEVQLAEMEALSLNSDKSSSILLGDESDNRSTSQLSPKETKDGQDSPDSTEAGDVGECLLPISSTDGSTNPDNYLCEIEKTPFNSVQSWLKHEGTKVPPSPFSPGTSCPLLPVPAEFFHPAISATQTGPEKVSCAHNLPKISLQGSWASLRSPSVNCSLLHQAPESDTSLDSRSSSSAGSLQTTLEDSLNLSDSPQCALDLPVALCPMPAASDPRPLAAPLSPTSRRRSLRGRGLFTLRSIRRHQRSHSSGGSTSPGCTHHDSMDPSDEEGAGSSLRGGGNNSEPSETLSSLSLTSLFSPPPPGLTLGKKCSSTSSLHASPSPRRPAAHHTKPFYTVDPKGFLSMPSWVTDFCKDTPPPVQGAEPDGSSRLGTGECGSPLPSELELGDGVSKRNR